MKDSVYIIEQPKHIVLGIVQIGDNYPKTDTQQKVLDALEEKVDLIFVFSGKREIDYRKFTTLHKGCGYIVCKEGTRAEATLGMVEYSREIFGKHLSFLFLNDWDIVEEITFSSLINNILEWTGSSIIKPLLEISRMNERELANIYLPVFKKSIFGGVEKCWKKGCEYTTHYSPSPYIFVKNLIFNEVFKKEKLNEYVETFEGEEPKIFLASILKDLGIKTMTKYEI